MAPPPSVPAGSRRRNSRTDVTRLHPARGARRAE